MRAVRPGSSLIRSRGEFSPRASVSALDRSSAAGYRTVVRRRSTRVCLITPAHLAANPRLVKEADALAEVGYDVQVFACQYMDWAVEADQTILRRAKWRWSLLCWSRDWQPYLFWKSRFRQHFCRHLLRLLRLNGLFSRSERLALRAYDRVLPELFHRVVRHPADLYIAHNVQALPVAATAARDHGAKVGFDAEDFQSGIRPFGVPSSLEWLSEFFERRYLAECGYITASSPDIADAYAVKYGVSRPVPILNVFSLWQRPEEFRRSSGRDPLTLYWFSQTIGANRGLEDVVRAVGNLGGCPIELHLRGNWQPGYRERLFRLAASVGLGPERIVVYDPAPPDELVRLASQFDIGLALEPGKDENNQIAISNKIFTYLLGGNAVIATATKGQRAIVEEIGKAGFCYWPGDVDALTQCLKVYFEDRTFLDAARWQAWEWGTKKYNWDLEKKKFLRVVETVLNS